MCVCGRYHLWLSVRLWWCLVEGGEEGGGERYCQVLVMQSSLADSERNSKQQQQQQQQQHEQEEEREVSSTDRKTTQHKRQIRQNKTASTGWLDYFIVETKLTWIIQTNKERYLTMSWKKVKKTVFRFNMVKEIWKMFHCTRH